VPGVWVWVVSFALYTTIVLYHTHCTLARTYVLSYCYYFAVPVAAVGCCVLHLYSISTACALCLLYHMPIVYGWAGYALPKPKTCTTLHKYKIRYDSQPCLCDLHQKQQRRNRKVGPWVAGHESKRAYQRTSGLQLPAAAMIKLKHTYSPLSSEGGGGGGIIIVGYRGSYRKVGPKSPMLGLYFDGILCPTKKNNKYTASQ
jgi:hypothetical protein